MARREKREKGKLGRLVNKEMAGEVALGGLGAVMYTGLPTALNMHGAGAMAVGLGSCLALGVWLESRALIAGGAFVAIAHLIYKYGSGATMTWWGRPIWSLDPSAPAVQGGMNDYVQWNGSGGHYQMSDAVQMPNGYTALALPPADSPAPSQMNDYVMQGQQLLDNDEGFLSHSRYEQNGSFESDSFFE